MSRPVSQMRSKLSLAALGAAALTLAACSSEPAGDPMGGLPANDYVLVGIGNGTVPLRNITLTLRPEGVSGRGPCNGYAAKNTVPLPAVAFEPLQTSGVTDCKDIAVEQRYFEALQNANEIEFYGGVLKIKGPTWLIFESGRPADQVTDALSAARGNE
ncbi:META domain-containing protein [Paracoccus sp. 1_MG-2023]|uniref:META domain-containing protein n=1 Tax=unclassified Paracoccus (in: a-proteobacteria) TaxID=2688777 RepID=UPI001C0A3E27|nr:MULTISPECIES: META domain-containing protein [unclassified Paracoccus (in: a-proteobacteria)]MBU2956984.1 META domain-containing protein [Paracoccus sp. C2R09]MDO6668181.1 META domain-containing protein [Paracoccus sp. 1_MG-2023]